MAGHPAQRSPSRSLALLLFAILCAPTLTLLVVSDEAEAARAVSRPALPLTLVGGTAVYVNDAFYIFGGRSGGQYVDTILRYDPRTNEVSQMNAKLPAPRYSMTGVAAEGKVFLFGGADIVEVTNLQGRSQRVPQSVADVLQYDPKTDRITRVATMPHSAWGMSASYNDRIVHLFGGLTFGYPNVFERRDDILTFDPAKPADGVKRASAKLRYPLQDASVAVLQGQAYIMGGLATVTGPDGKARTEVTRNIMVFDTRVPSEPTVAPYVLPERVHFAAAATGNGVLYVLGGRLPNETAVNNIFVVRPSEQVVTTHPINLPAGRWAPAGATHPNGDVYLFGGRDAYIHAGGTTDVMIFSPGVTEPTGPVGLRADPLDRSVRLTWSPPRYDGGSPLTGYQIIRVDGGFERVLTTTTATTWEDETARGGEKITYRVRAVNAHGVSISYAESEVLTKQRAPGPVASFAAYGANERVILRWSPPADDGGIEPHEYVLYKTDPQGDEFALRVSGGLTEYVDDGLVNGESYTYAIAPQNTLGSGPTTEPLRAVPAPVPDTPENLRVEAGGGAVVLEWDPARPHATEYVVLRGTTANDLAVIAQSVTQTRYQDISVAAGTRYYYSVTARNDRGESPPTPILAAAILERPSEPRNVQAIAGATSVRLAWDAPSSFGGHDGVVYDVIREESNGPRRTFEVGETLIHLDQNVQPGREYTYRVVAIGRDAPMIGLESAPVTVTTVNKIPEARLSTTVLHAKMGQEIVFDASASADPDGRIVAYRFEFKRGAEAVVVHDTGFVQESEVRRAFDEIGVYRVHLTVKDDAGAESALASVVELIVGDVPKNERGDDIITGGADDPTTGGFVARNEGENATPSIGVLLIGLVLVGVALARRRA